MNLRGRAVRVMAAAVLSAVVASGASAQLEGPLSFEVASVRPHEGPLPTSGGKVVTSGPRLTITGYSVLGLLMYAYNVRAYQISNAASLDHTMYDVQAIAPGHRSPSADEFRLMLLALLADRFKLRARREETETPVYALVVGPGCGSDTRVFD